MTDELHDYELRFGGLGRLYGVEGLKRLRAAKVCVVGIGGVGSWAAEALARSGIGELTLIDLDEVCVSNVNRQIPAMNGFVGRSKAEVMAERIRAINPEGEVRAISEFFTAASAEVLLAEHFDFLCDAIDSLQNKCLLIALCRKKGIPVVTTGGAGGRRDPTAVRVADLGRTTHDRLLQEVRKRLRRDHGFPRAADAEFGVPCVFSPEPQVFPQSDGTVCETREDSSSLALNCDSGYGTAAFVTGSFGLAAAGCIVSSIAQGAVPVGAARSQGDSESQKSIGSFPSPGALVHPLARS
jgi:tRNA threonylcarbamoyladenosine dehydratase